LSIKFISNYWSKNSSVNLLINSVNWFIFSSAFILFLPFRIYLFIFILLKPPPLHLGKSVVANTTVVIVTVVDSSSSFSFPTSFYHSFYFLPLFLFLNDLRRATIMSLLHHYCTTIVLSPRHRCASSVSSSSSSFFFFFFFFFCFFSSSSSRFLFLLSNFDAPSYGEFWVENFSLFLPTDCFVCKPSITKMLNCRQISIDFKLINYRYVLPINVFVGNWNLYLNIITSSSSTNIFYFLIKIVKR